MHPGFVAELFRAYGFPLVMFALAIVPGANFSYSGHGGPSWFFLPLCFPTVVARAAIKILRSGGETRDWYKKFFKTTISIYLVSAYPLSWAATTSIRMSFGLTIPAWRFFLIAVSPFPFWYFS